MSSVIKAAKLSSADSQAACLPTELNQRAQEYLAAVRQQATEVLATAEREAEGIRRQAEEQGRAAALESAQRQAEARLQRELAALLPAAQAAIAGIEAARAEWLAHWEQAALQVALAIAARVIRREVKQDPGITLTLLREALELATCGGEIQVRLHPDDVATLGDKVHQVVNEFSRLGQPRIVPDAAIEPGGCRVDTQFGAIDQQMESQLARIAAELS